MSDKIGRCFLSVLHGVDSRQGGPLCGGAVSAEAYMERGRIEEAIWGWRISGNSRSGRSGTVLEGEQ